MREIEISRTLYEVFDKSELIELSQLNEWDRHIEHSEVWEQTLNERALHKPKSVEETVFNNIQAEELHAEIRNLPEKQRRRLVLYFFGGFTYGQIAAYEKCGKMSVKQSIDIAVRKLRRILKK